MSTRDKIFGTITCIVAMLVGVIYFYSMFIEPNSYLDPLKLMILVVSLIVVVILGVIFWVGYTIATTPSVEEVEAAAKARKK